MQTGLARYLEATTDSQALPLKGVHDRHRQAEARRTGSLVGLATLLREVAGAGAGEELGVVHFNLNLVPLPIFR